jgi:hypothetical protein
VDTWLEHHARTAKLYPSGKFWEYSVETEGGYSVSRFTDHRDFSTYVGQCELAGDLKPWASHSACSMHSIYNNDRSFERFEQRGCVVQPWLVDPGRKTHQNSRKILLVMCTGGRHDVGKYI